MYFFEEKKIKVFENLNMSRDGLGSVICAVEINCDLIRPFSLFDCLIYFLNFEE